MSIAPINASAALGQFNQDQAVQTTAEVSGPVVARREERAAKRHPCSGRANVVLRSGVSQEGRIFDISLSGVGVLLDNRMPMNAAATLTLAVYKAGVNHLFAVEARLVHASLLGQTGFRHGFEFIAPDAVARRSIAALAGTHLAALSEGD